MFSDGDHIRNLLGTYCRLIDAGDFDAVGRLFAGATLCTEDGTVVATGAEEIAALYAGTTRRHADGTPLTQRVVANTVLEPLTDNLTDNLTGNTVRATSSYVVLQATESLPLQPIATGSYIDTFARTDAGWHFAERRFTLGKLGDLSQHLNTPLKSNRALQGLEKAP